MRYWIINNDKLVVFKCSRMSEMSVINMRFNDYIIQLNTCMYVYVMQSCVPHLSTIFRGGTFYTFWVLAQLSDTHWSHIFSMLLFFVDVLFTDKQVTRCWPPDLHLYISLTLKGFFSLQFWDICNPSEGLAVYSKVRQGIWLLDICEPVRFHFCPWP